MVIPFRSRTDGMEQGNSGSLARKRIRYELEVENMRQAGPDKCADLTAKDLPTLSEFSLVVPLFYLRRVQKRGLDGTANSMGHDKTLASSSP